jgi:hypothetical protein
MIMQWMEFGCETMLLAEMPETRQHFFLFLPDFLSFTLCSPLLQHYLQWRVSRTF